MYWSAITTRLLVGILTPAIRATLSSSPGHAKKREEHARHPRQSEGAAPARPSRPFAEGSPYRDRGAPVNGCLGLPPHYGEGKTAKRSGWGNLERYADDLHGLRRVALPHSDDPWSRSGDRLSLPIM